GDDGEVDAHGLQGAVRTRELGQVGVRRGAGFVARLAARVHTGVELWELSEGPDELGDVHPRSAVDLGRVLLAHVVDAHADETTPPCRSGAATTLTTWPPDTAGTCSRSSSPVGRGSG